MDYEQSTYSSFPRFLLIDSNVPEQPLSKLSPFVLEEVLVGLAGSPKSVKKLKSGSLLVEVEKAIHAKNLMKIKHFFNIPAKCVPHNSLNTCKGIIRCPDLADVPDDEIVSELASQNVTAARRITVFRDGVRRPTNTTVLTFNSSILPKSLKVGYLKVSLDIYISLIHFSAIAVVSSDTMKRNANLTKVRSFTDDVATRTLSTSPITVSLI